MSNILRFYETIEMSLTPWHQTPGGWPLTCALAFSEPVVGDMCSKEAGGASQVGIGK